MRNDDNRTFIIDIRRWQGPTLRRCARRSSQTSAHDPARSFGGTGVTRQPQQPGMATGQVGCPGHRANPTEDRYGNRLQSRSPHHPETGLCRRSRRSAGHAPASKRHCHGNRGWRQGLGRMRLRDDATTRPALPPPLPRGNHQPCCVAVPRIQPQPARRRIGSGRAGHRRLLRDRAALVQEIRPELCRPRATPPATARGQVAHGRSLHPDPRRATLSLARVLSR